MGRRGQVRDVHPGHFSLFVERGFTIKLPEQVPPAIGNSFAAIVPYAVVLGICWVIRTMLNIDLVAVLMGLLAPLVAGADNIFTFMGSTLFQQILWIVGPHGDNMWVTNFQPFGLIWLEENATALANGATVYELPHVLAAWAMPPSGTRCVGAPHPSDTVTHRLPCMHREAYTASHSDKRRVSVSKEHPTLWSARWSAA
jgi:hypothetical protein